MKISYNWLKEYIDIKKNPEDLAEDLSLFGHEVESVKKLGDDTILDFEITPNRGDCLSILGMAREVAALYNLKIKDQKSKINFNNVSSYKKIEINNSEPKICPRYTARVIENIEIKESPQWMKERLASYGFRPINNVVDITNYVMVATGQPLHAFDYDKIEKGIFNIRLSKKDEEVITLDGIVRKLPEGVAIIDDGEKIYDLAGIMGGLKSEVDEKTKTIVLQGSIFDPIVTRKTSKILNHSTDASYRYERSVDFEGTVDAVNLATNLIIDSLNSAKAGEITDRIFVDFDETVINYSPEKINHLLGIKLSADEINVNLERLNFKVNGNKAIVPSYRQFDVKIWQDLAEEVARIYGYNNLAKNNLAKESAKENPEFIAREKIKDILVELGFTEIYFYSFTDKKMLSMFGVAPSDQPQIAKPLSPETEYLRPSILPSLLTVASKNPWSPDINIFEMEAVFNKENEKWQLGLATIGKSDALLKEAVSKLNIDSPIQTVDQAILDQFKIRRPVKYLIIDVDDLNLPSGSYGLDISRRKYQPISRYAPTVRDFAFIVEDKIDSGKIAETIHKLDAHILLVELFDEFSSEKFGLNKKNIAFHVWIQDLSKNVDEKLTSEVTEKIISKLKNDFSAELRAS